MRVAFVVGEFPALSETFIINQVADLPARGIDVDIFTFKKGGSENISERYFEGKMNEKTLSLEMPESFATRFFGIVSKMTRLFFSNPRVFFRAINFMKYGRNALSGKLVFWAEPFVGKKYDLIHCHFGTIANRFLLIQEILGSETSLITTFYGYDVSHIPQVKGQKYYDRLKEKCHRFLVMSNDMKRRVVALGFPESEVTVLPVSVEVNSFPFSERKMGEDGVFRFCSVGRFVEKKGFDDMLHAVALLKEKTKKKFLCSIIGGGEQEKELKKLAEDLHITDVVEFKGYMKIEDIIKFYMTQHLFVQSSKTAKNGDME